MTKLQRAREIWQDIQDLITQVVHHSIYHRAHVRKPPKFEVRWVPENDAYYVKLTVVFLR